MTAPELEGAKRRPLRVAGWVVLGLVLLLLLLRVVGLDPQQRRPGLWLRGEVVKTPVTDWSFLPPNALMAVQTREWRFPLLATSVTTAYTIVNHKMYVPSSYPAGVVFPEGRRWNRNIAHDPRVRLKIGTRLYDRVLVRITDPAEVAALTRSFVSGWGTDLGSPGLYVIFFRVDPNDAPDTH